MYLDVTNKFYEIVVVKKTVFVHFGKIPKFETNLPFGHFIAFIFPIRKDAIKYMNKKLEEKKKKKYKIYKTKETYNMKWMRKNAKPKTRIIKIKKKT